jgi:hypothetical protein
MNKRRIATNVALIEYELRELQDKVGRELIQQQDYDVLGDIQYRIEVIKEEIKAVK